MRLELAPFEVRRIKLGAHTRWDDGVLTVDPLAIRRRILQDARLSDVDIEVAHPGDSTRIIHVLDCVEPRTKVAGSGQVFPGIVGPVEPVGSGRTHRLSGMAVLSAAVVTGNRETLDIWESIVDMGGAGAAFSPFSQTANLVLSFRLEPQLTPVDATSAVREAALRTAVWTAEVTRELAPPRFAVMELTPVPARLPKVAYICFLVFLNDVHTSLVYGRPITSLPTVLHPNEFVDGAVVSSHYHIAGLRNPTYYLQNNPMLAQLMQAHGRTVDFVGVVVAQSTISLYQEKERSALHAAQLARFLGADAAVLTLESGGNAFTDLMLTCRYCERFGIKTVCVMPEYAGSTGTEPSLPDFVPEALAIVSTGNVDETVSLPSVDRVLGGTDFPPSPTGSEPPIDVPPGQGFTTSLRRIQAATTGLGAWRLTCQAY